MTTLGCRHVRSHRQASAASTHVELPHLLHSFISRFISNFNFKTCNFLLTSFQTYEESSAGVTLATSPCFEIGVESLMVADFIGEVVEIGQWNLHGKPKKVVFTTKDGDRFLHNAHVKRFYELIQLKKLSDDYALIKFVLSKLPTLQHEEEVSPSISMMHEINDVSESKCFSATVESNPTLLGSITLAKHILPLSHSQLDGILFKDLSLIQLSSTRLGKQHIKTE
ncbi:hypothetical protein JHK82_027912 [Glycine max]|nr:hypothetical protein JHK82_027912 [Glycine max]